MIESPLGTMSLNAQQYASYWPCSSMNGDMILIPAVWAHGLYLLRFHGDSDVEVRFTTLERSNLCGECRGEAPRERLWKHGVGDLRINS